MNKLSSAAPACFPPSASFDDTDADTPVASSPAASSPANPCGAARISALSSDAFEPAQASAAKSRSSPCLSVVPPPPSRSRLGSAVEKGCNSVLAQMQPGTRARVSLQMAGGTEVKLGSQWEAELEAREDGGVNVSLSGDALLKAGVHEATLTAQAGAGVTLAFPSKAEAASFLSAASQKGIQAALASSTSLIGISAGKAVGFLSDSDAGARVLGASKNVQEVALDVALSVKGESEMGTYGAELKAGAKAKARYNPAAHTLTLETTLNAEGELQSVMGVSRASFKTGLGGADVKLKLRETYDVPSDFKATPEGIAALKQSAAGGRAELVAEVGIQGGGTHVSAERVVPLPGGVAALSDGMASLQEPESSGWKVKVTRRQDVKATVDAEVVGFKAEGEMETRVREYDGATFGDVADEVKRAGGITGFLGANAQLAGAAKG